MMKTTMEQTGIDALEIVKIGTCKLGTNVKYSNDRPHQTTNKQENLNRKK